MVQNNPHLTLLDSPSGTRYRHFDFWIDSFPELPAQILKHVQECFHVKVQYLILMTAMVFVSFKSCVAVSVGIVILMFGYNVLIDFTFK